MMILILFYYILFYYVWLSFLESCSFLMRDISGMHLDGNGDWEELEKVEGEKTVIKI